RIVNKTYYMRKLFFLFIFLMSAWTDAFVIAQDKRVFNQIMERIHNDNAVRKPKQADAPSIKLFKNWQEDGSWADVNYRANDMTNWQPVVHLERLRTIVNAYTDKGSSFYGNPQIFAKIQQSLAYWYQADPKS